MAGFHLAAGVAAPVKGDGLALLLGPVGVLVGLPVVVGVSVPLFGKMLELEGQKVVVSVLVVVVEPVVQTVV
jgi:hypothetical protein